LEWPIPVNDLRLNIGCVDHPNSVEVESTVTRLLLKPLNTVELNSVELNSLSPGADAVQACRKKDPEGRLQLLPQCASYTCSPYDHHRSAAQTPTPVMVMVSLISPNQTVPLHYSQSIVDHLSPGHTRS
jgi:hypothetical protein